MDLAGVAQSYRWELSSRTFLRKSNQPDKCLAAQPRTTLRNVLPTSALVSVAVTGESGAEGASKSSLELSRVLRARGGKEAQDGNQFLKSNFKIQTMTKNV